MKKKTLITMIAAAFGLLVLMLPAAASARDVNRDRIPDKWEKRFNLSLKVNQAQRNPDGDKLTNRQEFRAGTNPHKADTNGDGTEDGDNGGVIESFDSTNGTLVIDLFAGGTLTGTVTPSTQIECDGSDGSATASQEGSDDNTSDESGDNNDQGENETNGDDNDQGEDEGNCTTADLTAGTVVSEAETSVDSGGNTVFDQIDLNDNE